MKKFAAIAAIATALSFSAASAHAGGWGSTGNVNSSAGGLINVSPSIQTGNVKVLNGILNGSPIASGNAVKGILSNNGVLTGNNTGVGILGNALGVLNGGKRR